MIMDILEESRIMLELAISSLQRAGHDTEQFERTVDKIKAGQQVKNCNIAIVSKSVAKQYAEFCVRCDREGLPLLELDDYIKQYCC